MRKHLVVSALLEGREVWGLPAAREVPVASTTRVAAGASGLPAVREVLPEEQAASARPVGRAVSGPREEQVV